MSRGTAPRAAVSAVTNNARAEASRRNGAKSRGPKTPEGKARSAQNALTHGLRAETHVVLRDEDAEEFAALEASIIEELAPQGTLQRLLAGRVVRAAWRLERAERIEAELFELRRGTDGDLALALIRDGSGTRSFDTLLRYRGSALAEFFRALRLLQALQDPARAIVVPRQTLSKASSPQQPNEPETRRNPGESETACANGPGAARYDVALWQNCGPGAAAPPRDRAAVPRAQPSRSTP